MELSVIICTHNPRKDYLERTLNALRAQTLPKEQWELLLIDNASKEPLAKSWDLSWHSQARHIREEQLGLTPARLRGIKESKGELLLFVDDDNMLQPDYLAVLLNLAEEHSKLGCFGAGILEPEFEQEPSPELRPYTFNLALRSIEKPEWSNSMNEARKPLGAGLAVRRMVAEKSAAVVQSCPIRIQLDRCGSTLNSGGDDEFSWAACEMGLGKGLFPALKIKHLIGQKRVEKQYLLSIVKGNGFSLAMLAHLHGQTIYLPPTSSTFADILCSLFRAKLSMTLYHANAWWLGLHKPPIEKDFEDAWRSGVDEARKKLAELKPAKNN
jgi:glycosyltransferase involved in cell wall biosynthesis